MVHLFRSKEQRKNGRPINQTQVLPETMLANEPLPSGIPPEDAAVVTISRRLGNHGAEVGRLVAEKSGLHYVDQLIIAEVARRLGVNIATVARQDEQSASMIGHALATVKASTLFTTNYSNLFDQTATLAQSKEVAYLYLTQKVILELATQGNSVIVGRGSQFLLHSAPRTLHIHIFAPLPYRVENVMQRFQLNHATATQLIEQRDYEQDSYLRRYYGTDGQRPGLYHLLINTSLFSVDLAADIICQALPAVKAIK
jgi:CMP/dCMP kinase